MAELAIFGGIPIIEETKPHFSWPEITEKDINDVINQLKSGEISVYGKTGILKEFEENFSKYHNMKYGIATNSGTTALLSAFFACNIGTGDEVIAPTYTFLATATPIFHVNAKPVLIDCEESTGNIDPQEIEKKITSRTKAVVINHTWGHPCEMDKIVDICKKYNLYLIEDCSHAHGALYKGRKVGTFGDVSCFSLQGNKIVSAGEGGILLTNSKEIYERATLLGHYRDRSKQEVTLPFYKQFIKTGYGLKLRIHVVGAVLALNSLNRLDQNIEDRNNTLNYFSQELEQFSFIKPPVTKKGMHRGAFYGYKPHYIKEKFHNIPLEKFVEALQKEGVDVKKPGSKPLHLLPLFQQLNQGIYEESWPRVSKDHIKSYYRRGDFPIAEKFYSTTMSFPTFTKLESKKMIDKYILAIKKVQDNVDELINN